MEYSMGLFVYYFGTKKIYENVEHHTIKFGEKSDIEVRAYALVESSRISNEFQLIIVPKVV